MGESDIKFSRVWAMPNSSTFKIAPIAELLSRYISPGQVIIDPFSNGGVLATITNDLNPAVKADYHMEATDFLDQLLKDGIQADLCLFDPPYSPRQIAECYKSIGRKVGMEDTQDGHWNKLWKDRIASLMKVRSHVISFGWNSAGLGKNRGFKLIEIMLVPHGSAHNDTIVTVEKKVQSMIGD